MICLGMQALSSRTVYDVDDQLQDGAEKGGECASGGSSASQPGQH
jgi:hypothetical protein